MAFYTIPYGEDQLDFEVPDRNFLYYAAPIEVGDIPCAQDVIEHAFENPFGTDKLEKMVNPCQKIAILLDDITRPTPKRLLLDNVLIRLNQAGVPDANISIIVALGTHRKITDAEINTYYGQDLLDRYRFVNIDYKDASRFVDLGKSANGTPIHVYREVVEADFKIAIGNVVPHIAAGWGGGGKMIQPGVCSERTTAATHLMACTVQNVLESCGTTDNPCRQEIEMIAGQVGLDFLINSVLDENKNIIGIFCGHYINAHRAAVQLATQVLCPAIPRRADIVIASANPANIDFWQGCKPYIFAHFGVRRGGIIIFVIRAEEGLCGNAPKHERTVREYTTKSFAETKADIDSGRISDIVGANVPLFVATVRNEASVICVSEGLDARDIRDLGFESAASVDAALSMAYARLGDDATVGIIPFCGETLVREE